MPSRKHRDHRRLLPFVSTLLALAALTACERSADAVDLLHSNPVGLMVLANAIPLELLR